MSPTEQPGTDQLGAFIEAVPHAVVVSDAGGRVVAVNAAAERLLGYTRDEFATLGIEDLLPERFRESHAAQRSDLAATSGMRMLASGRELVARRKDGTEAHVLIGVAPCQTPDGLRLVASLVDNSARKEAERRADEQYRAAIEEGELSQSIIREAALGIIIYDAATGQCVSANEMAARITGMPRTALEAQNFRQIDSWRASRMLACAEQALAEHRTTMCEADIVTTGGRHAVLNCEFLAITRRNRPHLVLMMDDLTGRRDLETQLRAAQKMEAIGQLAGGVAHDFNNLLTVIGTYSSLMLEDTPPGDARREDLEEIFSAATRAATLTRQLLAFGRRQLLDARLMDLNEVVAALEKMLRRVLSAEIALDISLADDLGAIHADAGQVEQALMNLVVNARDAMGGGGTLRIATENVQVAPTAAEGGAGAAGDEPRPYAVLRVSDTGGGIPPDVLSHIFEPFFTTKDPGRGSGLGLSTTYGIVKQSGGFIRVHSDPGRGTTFELFFPRLASGAQMTVAGAVATADASGTGTIIVVEDDDHVRRIVVNALRERGYSVTEAADGLEALALAGRMPEPPDLLVTDVVMPNLNGRQLTERLRERWPDLRVLFTSAYAVDEVTGSAVTDLPGSLLRKPFVPAQLGAAVREAMLRERP